MTAAAAWSRHLGTSVDPAALVAELGAGTLVGAFSAAAGARPDQPALDVDGVARTHGELDAAAGRFAALLREAGLRPGDVVLFSAPSSAVLVEAYVGALRAGAVVLLANPSYTAGELEYLAGHSGAAVAVTDARDRLEGLFPTVLDVDAA